MKKNNKKAIMSVLGASVIGGTVAVAAIAQACGGTNDPAIDTINYTKFSDSHNLAFWSESENQVSFASLNTVLATIAANPSTISANEWSNLQEFVSIIPPNPTLVSVQDFDPDRIYLEGGVRNTIRNNVESNIFYIGGLMGLIYLYGSISQDRDAWINGVFNETTGINIDTFLNNINNIFTNIRSNIDDFTFLPVDFFEAANVAVDNAVTLGVTVTNNIATSGVLNSIVNLFFEFVEGDGANDTPNNNALIFLNHIEEILPLIENNSNANSSLNLSIGYRNSSLILRLGSEQNPDGYDFMSFQSSGNLIVGASGSGALGLRDEYFTMPNPRTTQSQVFRVSSIVFNNPPVTGINLEEQAIVLT